MLAFVDAVFIGAVGLEQLALGHEKPKHCQRQAEGFEVDPRFCAGCTPDQFVQNGEAKEEDHQAFGQDHPTCVLEGHHAFHDVLKV